MNIVIAPARGERRHPTGGVDLHWIISACAGVLLVVGCHFVGLPLRVDWHSFFGAFWAGMTVRAIFAATLLYLIGFPLSQTVEPVWIRYKQQKARIPAFLIFATWMLLQFGIAVGAMIVVDGLVIAELMDRSRGSLDTFARVLRSLAWPAAYLFFGLVAMFCYNDLIASMRFIGAYDAFFLKVDSALMNGHSVSGLVHSLTAWLPVSTFSIAEFIYYGMFGQVGAGLVLTALCAGRRESFRYVGTILTAYVIALVLFYFWPAIGPFYTCPWHSLPHVRLATYDYQQNAILKARLLTSSYKQFNTIGADYFIAFPCMHIAQPLVVLWFLRRWRESRTLSSSTTSFSFRRYCCWNGTIWSTLSAAYWWPEPLSGLPPYRLVDYQPRTNLDRSNRSQAPRILPRACAPGLPILS